MTILNQALRKFHPEFFNMTKEEQDIFKLEEHDDLDKKIKTYIHNALEFPEPSDGTDRISYEDSLKYNTIILPFQGIGPNSFMLNEFNWNIKILRFKNLYEFNENNHNFQERSTKGQCLEFNQPYTPTPLFNRLAEWARIFIDDEFFYLNILGIQSWLQYELENAAYTWIDTILPHKYVSGEHDGEVDANGNIRFDKEIDANGFENWYDILNKYRYTILQEYFDNPIDMGNVVYIVERSEKFNPNKYYVFGSMDVLKDITFTNFVTDCDKKLGDPIEFKAHTDKIIQEFITKLEIKLIEIKKNNPPTVD